MQLIHLSANEVVSTPIYAGPAPIPKLCPEGEHDWQPMPAEPVVHNGFSMSMETCSKCRYARMHGTKKE